MQRVQDSLVDVARDGNVTQILRCLDQGVHVDEKVGEGTPLMWAVVANKVDAVQLLLERKANVNAGGFQNDSALILAACKGSMYLCRILIDAGADASTMGKGGKTAAEQALACGNAALAKLLEQRTPTADWPVILCGALRRPITPTQLDENVSTNAFFRSCRIFFIQPVRDECNVHPWFLCLFSFLGLPARNTVERRRDEIGAVFDCRS